MTTCSHLNTIADVEPKSDDGCHECLVTGGHWCNKTPADVSAMRPHRLLRQLARGARHLAQCGDWPSADPLVRTVRGVVLVLSGRSRVPSSDIPPGPADPLTRRLTESPGRPCDETEPVNGVTQTSSDALLSDTSDSPTFLTLNASTDRGVRPPCVSVSSFLPLRACWAASRSPATSPRGQGRATGGHMSTSLGPGRYKLCCGNGRRCPPTSSRPARRRVRWPHRPTGGPYPSRVR